MAAPCATRTFFSINTIRHVFPLAARHAAASPKATTSLASLCSSRYTSLFSSSSSIFSTKRQTLPAPHRGLPLNYPLRRRPCPRPPQHSRFFTTCYPTAAAQLSTDLHSMSSVTSTPAPVRIFIAGGSYAGLSAAMNLLDLSSGASPRQATEPYPHIPGFEKLDVEITLADERDGWYHLIGSPLALADNEYAKKAWVKYADIPSMQVPNLKVVVGSVTAVDCVSKTVTTLDAVTKVATEHAYDFFVAATGLRRVWPTVPQSLSRKQYLVEAGEHVHAVSNAQHGVVVVGGGAVGIEMAGELKVVHPHIDVTLVHSRDKLLSSEGLSDECKDTTLALLREAGVKVLLNHRLSKSTRVETTDGSTKYDIEFTNGHKMNASEIIMAVSQPTSTATYMPTTALDENQLVKINPNLTLVEGTPNADYHLCAGDVAKWSGIKRCGAAMHGGHYAAYNIHQTILRDRVPGGHQPKYSEFTEFPVCIGLAVGNTAVSSGPESGTVSGPEVMQAYFRDDLGFDICWESMQLGGKKETVVEA
ncbi:Pyridine nucleotide-disulfide oxidoreductase, NAD-binding domain protein [Beauveria brongniartii RCEF 3172]|uniref:Pyridine nucleotide-disulfide oxidoreductase, NAD-binding domain protein n=1 Tax=Beauveria brongniartii RCEF 3172 TaxID=1081107 RepID=A0A167H569_9HYPO|nr:Pyridine nucleotide-disulfide oxidoreductase, NAD-binding domain protein [Beauveria brongniartii RCEF 3172]